MPGIDDRQGDHVGDVADDSDEVPTKVKMVPLPSSRPSPKAPVVLVIDDDSSVRTSLVRALGAAYTVYEAGDGEHARALLGVIPPPDAIVCDVTMPRLDGIGFAKWVREDATLRRTPILFLTARQSTLDVVTGINAGARHYMTKPFEVSELVKRVTEMTEMTKGAKR